MIVVNLKKSYPNLIRTQPSNPFALQFITQGDWPKFKQETLDGYDDILVGTYEDMIVTAYRISGASAVDYEGVEKTRFEVEEPVRPTGDAFAGLMHGGSFEPAAWLIGCPVPGGPWKRGEARGTRRYSIDDYRNDHPEFAAREGQDFGASMAEDLLRHFRGDSFVTTDDYPMLASSENDTPRVSQETGVTVVRQPGGTVVVTIPTGTRARIEIEPN